MSIKRDKGSKKVLIAMSGGVDSSVAAALLVKEGYEVIGVTMKIWRNVEDAKKVATRLGIPHYILSLEKEFEQRVIKKFYHEYSNGRTPNPCIICNQRIKFDNLLKKASAIGADFIATGHYARVGYDDKKRRYILKEAKDKSKDQSYVLFSLSQPKLARTIFPLGGYAKAEVRSLAESLGLKVFNRSESQEICFIDDNDYRRFLRERIGEKIRPGHIVDKEGNILGEHEGTCFFTIGQRRGIGIAKGVPLYVIDIDKANNRVIVGGAEELKKGELIAKGLNWIAIERLNGPLRLKAKIRYKHPKAWATISSFADSYVRVKFNRPQSAITPGQAVVFYDGDVVVGGGWIK